MVYLETSMNREVLARERSSRSSNPQKKDVYDGRRNDQCKPKNEDTRRQPQILEDSTLTPQIREMLTMLKEIEWNHLAMLVAP